MYASDYRHRVDDSPRIAAREVVEYSEELLAAGATPKQVCEKTGLTKTAVLVVLDRISGRWRERYQELRRERDLLKEECKALRATVGRLRSQLNRRELQV